MVYGSSSSYSPCGHSTYSPHVQVGFLWDALASSQLPKTPGGLPLELSICVFIGCSAIDWHPVQGVPKVVDTHQP